MDLYLSPALYTSTYEHKLHLSATSLLLMPMSVLLQILPKQAASSEIFSQHKVGLPMHGRE